MNLKNTDVIKRQALPLDHAIMRESARNRFTAGGTKCARGTEGFRAAALRSDSLRRQPLTYEGGAEDDCSPRPHF